MALGSGLAALRTTLPRAVRVLFVARIVNALGSFVFPFLTVFLTATLELPKATAARFVVAAAAFEVAGAIVGGKLADRFSKKRVLVFCTLTGAALMASCAFLGASMAVP